MLDIINQSICSYKHYFTLTLTNRLVKLCHLTWLLASCRDPKTHSREAIQCLYILVSEIKKIAFQKYLNHYHTSSNWGPHSNWSICPMLECHYTFLWLSGRNSFALAAPLKLLMQAAYCAFRMNPSTAVSTLPPAGYSSTCISYHWGVFFSLGNGGMPVRQIVKIVSGRFYSTPPFFIVMEGKYVMSLWLSKIWDAI